MSRTNDTQRHVSHVAWDPDKGFDMNNMDHDMQKLFQLVDIKLDGDVDKEIIDFVYDFVEKHGGIEAVKKEFGPGNAKSMPPLPLPTNRGNVTAAVPPPPPSCVGALAIARVAMNNMDHDMQKLFQLVDIKLDGDVDKEIIDFVYDFVEKHGGIEAVKKEFGPGNAKSMPPLPLPTNRGNVTAAVPPPPPSCVGALAIARVAMNNMDHDMQKLFQSVDIKLDGDVDKEIIDFVYDFVEKHGGIEAVKKEFGPGNAKSMPPLPPATNKGNVTAAVLPLPPSRVGS